jgi:hypothetical protein
LLDGQAIAAKLSKQITQRTNGIKVSVEKYNASLSSWKEKVDGMPEPLKFDDVKDPQCSIFADFRGNSSNQDGVPFSVKRNVIDLYHLIERCKEEVSYLNMEIVRLVKYYENRVSVLERFLHSHVDDTSVYIKGMKCVARRQIREEKNKLYGLGSIFKDNLPMEFQSSLPECEFKFEATRTLNVFSAEISTNSEELEIVNSDNDDINDEDHDEEFALVLDLSDDEEYI